jgi:hypothetical protein
VAEVLEQARRMRYQIGSNLHVGGPPALWTLLLPSLDVDAVSVVGEIDAGEHAALERLFRVVSPVSDRSGRPLTGHRLDAVRIGAGVGQPALDGAAIVQALGADDRSAPVVFADCRQTEPDEDRGPMLLARSAPDRPRVLAAADDPAVRAWLHAAGWLAPSPRTRLRRPSGLVRALRRAAGGRQPEHAHLAGSAAANRPPRYVVDIAAEEGMEIADDRWALVAPGAYATQKVLLFLFRHGASHPHTIVKLAPDPGHVDRLMNEAEALRRLATVDLGSGRIPALRFAGVHAGRGVVGEEWLAGRAFRAAAHARADCPYLAGAAASLTELAVATRGQRPAAEVGHALRDLFDRFLETYRVTDAERRFLADRIAALSRHEGSLPTVVQHGDPGAWNLMVDEADRIVILDWESSESAGLPLWDLVYFLRSYGTLTSRRQGIRDRLALASRHLLDATELNARFAADVSRHARAVELRPTLIEPLFYACWMHRALKEATRRTPARLESAHYRRLLGRLIERHDAPALRRLLSGTA